VAAVANGKLVFRAVSNPGCVKTLDLL